MLLTGRTTSPRRLADIVIRPDLWFLAFCEYANDPLLALVE